MFIDLGSLDLSLWFPVLVVAIGLVVLFVARVREGKSNTDIFEVIGTAGFVYDPEQDIFYSKMDPWQRNMGYCRLYDESLAPLGMVIDCEPIYFEYEGKRWLIEFWKGQYALNSGCEIGVYTTEGPDLEVPNLFSGTFYRSVGDDERLPMSCELQKNGQLLLTRTETHWWLTGFKLGEFSEPSELRMRLSITLKDQEMRNAFVEGLTKAGYLQDELVLEGNTVKLEFAEPRTPQPVTRAEVTDRIIQKNNRLLCDKYQEITGPYDNFLDKLKALQEQAPDLFGEISQIGKTKQTFGVFETLKPYLD